MNVRLEFGEFVVPVNDHPMACERSMAGDPASILGERTSSLKRPPGEGATAKDNFRRQFGNMSCLVLVISYSCSV